MTHGVSDQSGKPVKTTKISGKEISYDTRTGDLTAEYGEESEIYDTGDHQVEIPRYGYRWNWMAKSTRHGKLSEVNSNEPREGSQ